MDGGFGGFGKKAAAGQGAAAAGAAAAGATEDYDLAARELFARLNLPASGDAGAAAQDRYANLDAIWSDPQTKAKVFIGNQTAAKSQPTLEANGITHIINCQDVSAPNFTRPIRASTVSSARACLSARCSPRTRARH